MSSIKSEILKLADETLLPNSEIAKIVGCSLRTVNRYAGSYTKRCHTKAEVPSGDAIQKTILLPDIHYPHYDQRVMDAVDEFIIDYDPDELVYMGDQLDLSCISGWNRRKPLLKEGRRLLSEYEGFDENILQTHENITRDETRRVFMMGNHEQRTLWYIQENPELEGMIDIDRNLNLSDRGYNIVDYNGVYKIGKLNVIHGYYYCKYHAAKTVDVFEGNVVYSHVHNPQMYAKISPIDRKGYHTATALPCLCNIKPDYKQNSPNFWINGFGIVEHIPSTGYFNLYTVIIIDNKFLWNGKLYGSTSKYF